jgi:catechol 2,3-dioxygenase-like lactoylglutathione lyase family enzyme
MTFKLDHVVIAVKDLDQAVADYEAMGFITQYGGKHASGTTHNALITFKDGSYLELLAPTGEPPSPNGTDFSWLFQRGEHLVGFAFHSEHLEQDAAALRAKGVNIGAISEGRRDRPDGVEIRWRGAAIDDGLTMFFVEDVTPRRLRVSEDPADTTHPNGVTRIEALELLVPELTSERIEYYGKLLGAPVNAVDDRCEFYPQPDPVSNAHTILRLIVPSQDGLEAAIALHHQQIRETPEKTPGDRAEVDSAEQLRLRYQMQRDQLEQRGRSLYSLTLRTSQSPAPVFDKTHGIPIEVIVG